MGGKFVFELKSNLHFDAFKYRQALKEIRKEYKPPSEVYASFGPEDMGIGLLIKVQHKNDWMLLLPSDPLKRDIECGFTYGIVSRGRVWDYVRNVLSHICKAVPHAFEFSYEDHDLGEFSEVGYYDYKSERFVVVHHGVPTAAEIELAVAQGSAKGWGMPKQAQHPMLQRVDHR